MISTGSRGERGERGSPAQVTSLVNHELSSPLATALLYLGIAEGHCAAEPAGPARTALAVARGEIQRLKQLVDRVTELEETGTAVIRPALVDLGAVVADAVNRAIAFDIASFPHVSVECARGVVGWWDEIAVGQIVTNLLSNAFKFGGGGPIEVGLRASGRAAWLSVQDGGTGVPPSERQRIFERHAAAPRAQGGGLGLGLWLVRELARAHGGFAMVHSSSGRGATFVINLRSQLPVSPRVTPMMIGPRKERNGRVARRAPAAARPAVARVNHAAAR
jgi:signal transduction histidine kinase